MYIGTHERVLRLAKANISSVAHELKVLCRCTPWEMLVYRAPVNPPIGHIAWCWHLSGWVFMVTFRATT